MQVDNLPPLEELDQGDGLLEAMKELLKDPQALFGDLVGSVPVTLVKDEE